MDSGGIRRTALEHRRISLCVLALIGASCGSRSSPQLELGERFQEPGGPGRGSASGNGDVGGAGGSYSVGGSSAGGAAAGATGGFGGNLARGGTAAVPDPCAEEGACAAPEPCADSPCAERARCLSNAGAYVCDCPPGFSGPTCEITPIDLAGSEQYVCILLSDGSVRCSAANSLLWSADQATVGSAGPFVAIDGSPERVCGLSIAGVHSCIPEHPLPEGPFSTISVGRYFACGVRTNGSLECWGNSPYAEIEPPAGVFKTVAVGLHHACALRLRAKPLEEGQVLEGIAECWGEDEQGELFPPATPFTSLVAGSGHNCGLTAQGTVECWGDRYGRVPSGTFTELAASAAHTCGLSSTGSIQCWGEGPFLPPPPERGPFVALATGYRYVCGLRADGLVDCTGELGQAAPPEGHFLELSVGDPSCALREDGSLACWSTDPALRVAEPGPFTQVTSTNGVACALAQDGRLSCWGATQHIAPFPEDERFSAIDAGASSLCAVLASDGSLRCWGAQQILSPPVGSYTSVAVEENLACALDGGGITHCWGTNYLGASNSPNVPFTDLDVGSLFGCGLESTGRIRCWGYNDIGQANAPSGDFLDLSASSRHGCAIRRDGTVTCWGRHNAYNGIQAPPGWFRRVASGYEKSCGIRVDGTLRCWGAGFY